MNRSILQFTNEVAQALKGGQPVLALESTIISHGMPYPDNLDFAKQSEKLVRSQGVVPAIIAIIDGILRVGLDEADLQNLASGEAIRKITARDIAAAMIKKDSGATTVSATMLIARQAGIEVFATGGIGGVHRDGETSLDVSQDLRALSRIPIIVVSAGAKAILDLRRTLEYLETEAITLVGYKTDKFPAFYSIESGFTVPDRVDSASEIVAIYRANKKIGLSGSTLVVNPIPAVDEIPQNVMESYIRTALEDCSNQKIYGNIITPYLLDKIADLTKGRSLQANISLALNNVRLGSEIAKALKTQQFDN